jgi:DNA-binding NtrC family response regulator
MPSSAVAFSLFPSASQSADLRSCASTVRIICQFREDLFYWLNVVKISLPPLRERREDIPLLVQGFLGRSEKSITIRQDALDLIAAHDWPGNVRELENVIARAIAIAPGGVITGEWIEFPRHQTHTALGWLDQIPCRFDV